MIAHVGRGFSMRRNEVAPATLLFFYLFLIMGEIGRASCRGKGEISGVAVSFKKKKKIGSTMSGVKIGASAERKQKEQQNRERIKKQVCSLTRQRSHEMKISYDVRQIETDKSHSR